MLDAILDWLRFHFGSDRGLPPPQYDFAGDERDAAIDAQRQEGK